VSPLIDIVLLGLLVVTAVTIIRLRDLFAVVMLFGIYSLLSAALFVTLNAPDVAFTEAVVGAGISTVLMLATLALTSRHEHKPAHRAWLPLGVVLVTGSFLVYGTLDIPPFGAADNPAHGHVAPLYLEESGEDIGIPNVVTSVLASYRGYDTLGETAVIFTAGMSVLVLLGRGLRRKRDQD
jgi:multicomponent Na+:H+ antiporter subunit B